MAVSLNFTLFDIIDKLILTMELCENGSLQGFLRKGRSISSWNANESNIQDNAESKSIR
jgi:hypothetical protein